MLQHREYIVRETREEGETPISTLRSRPKRVRLVVPARQMELEGYMDLRCLMEIKFTGFTFRFDVEIIYMEDQL